MTTHDDHRWTAAHHLAWSVGLLDETDEARVREHLDICDECRGDFLITGDSGRRHLPAAMIARWETAKAGLSGLERRAVAEHLNTCGDCREDLRTFGHAPNLDAEPLATRPTPQRTAAPRRSSFARGLFNGALGGVLGAVAATVVLMNTGPAETPTTEVLPWVAPSQTRGVASQLAVPADTRQVTLTLAAPTAADPGRDAEVMVTGPDGTPRVTLPLTPEAMAQITVLVVLRTPDPLPLGAYEVEFRQDGEVLETTRFTLVDTRR